MNAERSAERPPYFSAYANVDVDVDVSPRELEEAGWVYVGKKDKDAPKDETVLEVVQAWHAETHPHHWRFCQEEPCHSLNREAPRA